MAEDPNNETQRKIRDLIRKRPGLDIDKIAELLNMSISEVEPYLLDLEKKRLITAIQDAGKKQYYMETFSLDVPDRGVQETWKKIYELIAEHPGLHLSKIAKLLKMSKPLAEYHLRRLERDQKITVIKEVGYKRYYIYSDGIGLRNKKKFSLLRKEVPLKIVFFLANNPNAKHKVILEHLNIAPSTLSYHLNALMENGIVYVQRYGKEKGYSIKNEKEVVEFVIKYRLHVVFEGFKDLWDELNYKRW